MCPDDAVFPIRAREAVSRLCRVHLRDRCCISSMNRGCHASDVDVIVQRALLRGVQRADRHLEAGGGAERAEMARGRRFKPYATESERLSAPNG